MAHSPSSLGLFARFVERLTLRTVGAVAGIVLTCIGLGMGVTVVMLPLGLAVGAAGVLLLIISLSIPRENGVG